jgi:hypothetical protein
MGVFGKFIQVYIQVVGENRYNGIIEEIVVGVFNKKDKMKFKPDNSSGPHEILKLYD